VNTSQALDTSVAAGARSSELGLRVACLLVSLLAALPSLRLLSYVWMSSDYLAHGYLIPVTSAGLIWLRRERIRGILRDSRAPALGPLVVLAAALFQAGSLLAEAGTFAGIGVVLTIAATVYAVGGRPLLRTLAVPVGFLLLMVPPPVFLQDQLLFGLKAVVIQISVALLHAFGFSVAATGNRLFVPGHELFVANACSGLTSVVTLLPLAVVVAYLLGRGVWRRLLLVGSIVPIAILGNTLRVVVTVVLVSWYGMEYAEGLLHDSFGLATFMSGTVVLVGLARVLR
jgi:exosortase